MYASFFREWKVAALFVAGISLFVAAYFAEGGGHEQLAFGGEAPAAAAPAPAAVAAPAAPAAPDAARFTSDEELQSQFADPAEATPAASPAAAAVPAAGGAEAGGESAGMEDGGEAPTAAASAAPGQAG